MELLEIGYIHKLLIMGKLQGLRPCNFQGNSWKLGASISLLLAPIYLAQNHWHQNQGAALIFGFWTVEGPPRKKNQSVGYESKCPGLRLNFRQTFSCLERHFPFLGLTAWPWPTALARQPSDLGKESSSRGMKSLPSVLPRPGHLLSYPTERLFF